MTATVTIAGHDVLSAHIVAPSRGAWYVDASIDTATAPTGRVEVKAVDGLTLSGTVVRAGVNLDRCAVRIVGGAGGLAAQVAGAYRSAKLRDPLGAVATQAGETLGEIASDVGAVDLAAYTLGEYSAERALGELVSIGSSALGQSLTWRVLRDGKVWLGAESWPAVKLAATDSIMEVFPAEGRTVIGVSTPAVWIGDDVDGFGRVCAVEHWIAPSEIRTWAWV